MLLLAPSYLDSDFHDRRCCRFEGAPPRRASEEACHDLPKQWLFAIAFWVFWKGGGRGD